MAGLTYQYDANANITNSQQKALSGISYDPFTQLTMRATETSQSEHLFFEYGGNKQRILKVEQVGLNPVPNSTLYLHGMNDYPLTEKYNEQGTISDKSYVYGPHGLIAIITDGSTCFVVKDHLGSNRVVLNNSNQPVSWYDFDPFGEVWRSTVNTGSTYQFTGQEFDTELGLHNFRARMYDSWLGRFCSMDPARQSQSPFSYAANNPLIFGDKDGRFLQFLLPAILFGAFSGVTHAEYEHQTWFEGLASGAFFGGLGGLASLGVGSLFGDLGTSLLGHLGSGVASSFAGGVTSNLTQGRGILEGWVGFGISGLLSGVSSQAQTKNNILALFKEKGFDPEGKWLYSQSELDRFNEAVGFNKMADAIGVHKVSVYTPEFPQGGYSYDHVSGYFWSEQEGEIELASGLTIPDPAPFNTADGVDEFNTTIWLGESAFETTKVLYLAMRHELVHATDYFSGVASQLDFSHNILETRAYKVILEIAESSGLVKETDWIRTMLARYR